MDKTRGQDDRRERAAEDREAVGHAPEPQPAIGGDERRMHVRAYNHWVSLLRGRAFPGVDELDPATAGDFGPHGVLLDFSEGNDEPRIRFLGHVLREECGVSAGITRIADVPSGSLLARLTEQYPQILASRAPIGFEAEFVSRRGHPTLYRGILMPFSSDQRRINYLYGVINWKEVADPATQAQLTAEIAGARDAAPHPAPAPVAPVWADGPSGGWPSSAPEAEVVRSDTALEAAPSLGTVAIDTRGDSFVLLLARSTGPGHAQVIARIDDPVLLEQAIARTLPS